MRLTKCALGHIWGRFFALNSAHTPGQALPPVHQRATDMPQTPDTARQGADNNTDDNFPFFHTFECALVLLMHKVSGKVVFMEVECWHALVRGIERGALPEPLRRGS